MFLYFCNPKIEIKLKIPNKMTEQLNTFINFDKINQNIKYA